MKYLIVALIRVYRYCISPLSPPSCRFLPSCSEYSLESVQKHGALRGSWFSLRRICKCHPYHPGGYDPVR